MRPDIGRRNTSKSAEQPQEPFTLTGTLEQYEVEELDATEIEQLLVEKRRGKGRTIASDPI